MGVLWLVLLSCLPSCLPDMLCPKRCTCQNLLPSYTVLCAKTGLLFVPPNIDRQTAELRLMDNFITTLRHRDFANMTSLVSPGAELITPLIWCPASGATQTSGMSTCRWRYAVSSSPDYLLCLLSPPVVLVSCRLTAVPVELSSPESRRAQLLQGSIRTSFSMSLSCPPQDFLETLEDLDLSYNNLVDIPWDTVSLLVSVNTLSLDHNLIESVPEGIFSNLHKLASYFLIGGNKVDVAFGHFLSAAAASGHFLSAAAASGHFLSDQCLPADCINIPAPPQQSCVLIGWRPQPLRGSDRIHCSPVRRRVVRLSLSVLQEEFVCEPPMITRHTSKMFVMEGQEVSLRCKSIGDPEPSTHWVSPDGKLIGNTSRTVCYENGSLDILKASVKDSGKFMCIASNAAGEATAPVELVVNASPHFGPKLEPDPGPSDIPTSIKSNVSGGQARADPQRVSVSDLTSSSALIRWPPQNHIPGVRMYQVQYNSSTDDILIYRMIPANHKYFLLSDLAAARDYELCVLAVYDDGVTALTGTKMVGCVSFTTDSEYGRCHSIRDQFLGGTMIIIIGGIIVASVLVFIFILLMKYKLHSNHYKQKAAARHANVCSQTNGGGGGGASGVLALPPSAAGGAGANKSCTPAAEAGASLRGTTVVDLNPSLDEDAASQ
ncbi:leucine-rich repeat and fibronectin type III domain-containing protein 1-like protein [Poecilia reticulata]|uniref:leucine-rich repeat and fibronectin type III domain-containing protein 1-like protein n=1 Tax=Poecilia reticulata TaxID=8081 RepID=UPI0007EC1F81|nr:PREDICTED: leucine-rich repeat and fibronectin type III domain-containing protein 1-like protein [Poecilia reticulata]